MPKIAYVAEKKFKPETLEIIRMADKIASDYKRQGYDLTLRQLYYQFISIDFFPNTEKSYGLLGRTVNNARLAGLIDWSHITDRGRNAESAGWFGHEEPTIPELVRDLQYSYLLDPWEGQERRVEVWVEKQALEQVVERATQGTRTTYLACKGYMSQSEMWAAARRMTRYSTVHPQPTLLLHLGDHDPSGIDMTRDIEERLNIFGANVEVRRIALTMDQVDSYNPPPNPAKQTDSRFQEYADRFGDESWELDALEPSVLVNLIQEQIMAEVDISLWNAQTSKEEQGRDKIEAIADRWDEVVDYLALDDGTLDE